MGAGPAGCELSQTLQRLGAEVALLDRGPHILSREDEDAARMVEQSMMRDEVRVLTELTVIRVECRRRDKVLTLDQGGVRAETVVDEILVGTGRAPKRKRARARSGRRRLGRGARSHSRRPNAHDQPPDLCCGRRRFALQIHSHFRRDSANRHS